MNTQAITAELAADIERAMRETLAADTLPAERELARMVEIQAGLAARYEARIAEAGEERKAELARLADHKRALREKHRTDMAALREQEQAARDRAERSIRADTKLAAAARAAMKEIEA